MPCSCQLVLFEIDEKLASAVCIDINTLTQYVRYFHSGEFHRLSMIILFCVSINDNGNVLTKVYLPNIQFRNLYLKENKNENSLKSM